MGMFTPLWLLLASVGVQAPMCEKLPEPPVDSPEILERFSLEKKNAALETLLVDEGWSCPVLVPGNVNNLAWQDSADLSWDGSVLSFMEASLDPLSWDEGGATFETLFEFQRGPTRGRDPSWASRFYNAALTPEGEACKATLFPFTSGTLWEWGGQRARDGTWTYVGFDPSEGRYNPDIYQDGEKLPFNTELLEDDPHYVSETGELFFWSNELPGGGGVETIWMTQKRGESWDVPVPLTAPVNLPDSNQRQPHLTPAGFLYYASSEADGALGIYRVRRLGDNAWGEKRWIVRTPSELPPLELVLVAVGEPTLDLDGRMAFVVLFYNTLAGGYDADVAMIRPGACP